MFDCGGEKKYEFEDMKMRQFEDYATSEPITPLFQTGIGIGSYSAENLESTFKFLSKEKVTLPFLQTRY
jgi:hypothetical protein